MFLITQNVKDVYSDTVSELKMKETISKHICEQIKSLREEFKALPFDFHSCFFYNPEALKF